MELKPSVDEASTLKRFAFMLHLREGAAEAYDQAHREVWPEMLQMLKRGGIREYSIFRRDQQLFLYMQVANFQHVLSCMAASEVNLRWQKTMEPLFEPVPGKRPDEPFAMMTEVFHLVEDSSPD